jgi:Peroxisomal biogenesis factor 11 (PEX11)
LKQQSLRVLQYLLALFAALPLNSKFAKAILKPVSEARVTMRIFGFPASLVSLISTLQERPVKPLLVIQDASLAVYYAAELRWWLAINGAAPTQNSDAWSQLSCGGWAIWLLLEIHMIQSRYRNTNSKGSLFTKQNSGNIAQNNMTWVEMLHVANVLFDTPLALGWSSPWIGNRILGPRRSSLLGFLGGVALFLRAWDATNA